jgi:Zn-finger nucleic acid-binding protein
MNPNECPCCDDGVLSTWRVAATNETILICDQCDSVWEDSAELPGPVATTVDQFLAARGRPPLWSELHRLGQASAA